jgi:hypothetical protein
MQVSLRSINMANRDLQTEYNGFGSRFKLLGLVMAASGICLGLAASLGGDLLIAHVHPDWLSFTGSVSLIFCGVTGYCIGDGLAKERPWAIWLASILILLTAGVLASSILALAAFKSSLIWIPMALLIGLGAGLIVLYRHLDLLSAVPFLVSEAWIKKSIHVPAVMDDLLPGTLVLSNQLIKIMEVRSEAVYHPGRRDSECAYAITGGTAGSLDMLHSLASDQVMKSATPNMVETDVSGMVKLVLEERQGKTPGCLLQVHTHPDTFEAIASEKDLLAWQQTERWIRQQLPKTEFYFGIHAVSKERPGISATPKLVAANKVGWASVCRDHEIAIFTTNGKPARIALV